MRYIILIATILGILLMVDLIVKKQQRFRKTAEVAQATVMGIEKFKNHQKGGKMYLYKVMVEFETFDKTKATGTFTSRSLPKFKVGQTIEITYNTLNPRQLRYP